MDLKEKLGFGAPQTKKQRSEERSRLIRYINLQMIANELPPPLHEQEAEFADLLKGLLTNYHEKARMLRDVPAPVDARIESFLADYFSDLDVGPLQLPRQSFILDRHGIARELSIPVNGDKFESELVESYRLENGVLNNPRSDRRTTKGTFHVCEGGLPIAADKLAVPKETFARMFQIAMNPPQKYLELPYTSQHEEKAYSFVSLLLRPIVCPEVPGFTPEKTMEVRFYVPGQLVSNLDFVESIFGNAGDPFIPKNDAALDVEHWTGHTGCVILAPQLLGVSKKELGLPHFDDATERQRQDGMCWKEESEIYNDGQAFKLTCRDQRGVVVTLIADNYYGYCKKEVKTQLSYAANLYGNVEEEHAGGVIAYTSWNLGEDFRVNSQRYNGRTIDDVARDYGEWIDMQPEGYGIDKNYPDIVYIPEDARATMVEQCIKWSRDGEERSIPLLPGKIYVAPSGYKIRMEKHPAAPSWRLIGTMAEGVNCHKPCTVSGGGKSEISKSATDYMLYGPIFVNEIDKDLELIDEIFNHDYSDRWAADSQIKPNYAERPSRKILSPERSLGSVIKLLTPSADYTDKYNEWLASIPNHIYSMLFIIKRFQQPDWDHNWRANFSVDIVNGTPGHELKYLDRTLVGTYLRVGLSESLQWRTYKLRQDFYAADKVQTEDDISASVVVPAKAISNLDPQLDADSYKFLTNCEYRLFQRPDDAVHRGLDKQTEFDLSQPGNFISNFAPLNREDVAKMAEQIAEFDQFTLPMQSFLREFLDDPTAETGYAVCSAFPRIVNGVPTKNPRYLQTRPDMANPIFRYVGEVGTRLYRKIPADQPAPTPVNAVLCGRRNNPPDAAAGIRSLAVYGPIHYQELPELFMDFVCSLTGKSPSTTGAGSEGALTKGPFNALRPAADLNNALVSYILTGLAGYSTAAGYIGPNVRVDHDVSLLIPEIWCRLTPEERDPKFLIGERMLEKIDDFTYNGEAIPASRLGYRITRRFVRTFFGRVFDNPLKVFDDSILRPETQDPDSYADGIKHIVEAQQRVAARHLQDGSVEEACPPLKALLMIMAEGSYEGKTASDPEFRQMFTKKYLLSSDWYRKRLATKKSRDTALWKRHVAAIDKFTSDSRNAGSVKELGLAARREYAAAQLAMTENEDYLVALEGTLGAHPFD
ncbi:hypothetical protein [Blastopirellula retiformator]|uniref:PPi-type phosphoenolpyruvate carboxykinase lobe 2 domain-containing protein n=1 Tax=Blastopirellula retiformator TaxID=2527970 RepID=A0A5C5VPI1_9BACT|nr:hypothetical protein [Blastopirellula retiformator]TWT39721.1 hypothetical protein Enr8_14220 [Blastopirellula retiformator]